MIFFGQDNQTVVVIVEIDSFNQFFHVTFLSAAAVMVSPAEWAHHFSRVRGGGCPYPGAGFRAV
jgi:hypothetical protein